MNLQYLAIKEIELYKFATSLNGAMEERTKHLEQNGVFEQYKEIHKAYAELHKRDLEALKRGLFLTWYALVEPPCFTGVRELDMEAERKIMKTLDRRLKKKCNRLRIGMDVKLLW